MSTANQEMLVSETALVLHDLYLLGFPGIYTIVQRVQGRADFLSNLPRAYHILGLQSELIGSHLRLELASLPVPRNEPIKKIHIKRNKILFQGICSKSFVLSKQYIQIILNFSSLTMILAFDLKKLTEGTKN